MSKILITDNGPHSAEKWAMTTAETIFPLDGSGIVGERLIAGQKFQTQLAEMLSNHHGSVMEDERNNLQDVSHYNKPLDAQQYLDHVVDEIVSAAKSTPWAAHFARQEVQAAVRDVVENHFLTAQHTERLWHADTNHSEEGHRYRMMSQQGQLFQPVDEENN